MTDYPPYEIVDMIMILGECQGVYVRAAALYAECYPNRRHPTNNTIRDLTTRAREGRLYRERRRHEYGENDNRILTVLAVVHLNPHISSREIARQHGIPKSTVFMILNAQRYHAYHITLTQELTLRYFALRLQFCQWALQHPELFTFVMF